MTAATDTGIAGDQNTKLTQPQFIGQVYSTLPGNGGQPAGLRRVQRAARRAISTSASAAAAAGFAGPSTSRRPPTPSGTFTITAPVLPEGFQYAQIVVVGQADQPPLPGFSSSQDHAFRIDQTAPSGHSEWPRSTARLRSRRPITPSLQSLTLNVQDPVLNRRPTWRRPLRSSSRPSTRRPPRTSATTRWINADGTTTDESQFITTATFVATAATLDRAPSSPTTTARST